MMRTTNWGILAKRGGLSVIELYHSCTYHADDLCNITKGGAISHGHDSLVVFNTGMFSTCTTFPYSSRKYTHVIV